MMGAAKATAWVGVLILVAGCANGIGHVANPQSQVPAGEDSAAFLDRLSSQRTVSEDDALHGLLLLLDGKDESAGFEQRVDALRKRGVLAEAWELDAGRSISRGRVAYAVYQACDFSGGLILTLTGPSPRYCLRELRYRRMMGNGSQLAPVTGMEFAAILTRADIYVRTGQVPDRTWSQTTEGEPN
jgi:hypothetical protein